MQIELTTQELIAVSTALDFADFKKFREFHKNKLLFQNAYKSAKDKINLKVNEEIKAGGQINAPAVELHGAKRLEDLTFTEVPDETEARKREAHPENYEFDTDIDMIFDF